MTDASPPARPAQVAVKPAPPKRTQPLKPGKSMPVGKQIARLGLTHGLLALLILTFLICAQVKTYAQGTIQQSGPATTNDALCFVQNGIAKDCGFPPASALGVCQLRTINSGTSDIASTSDCTIAWNSSATSAKTEFLYGCTASTKSGIVTIVDDYGTANFYSISVVPSGVNTILLSPSFTLNFSRQSMTFQCDGLGNWVGN